MTRSSISEVDYSFTTVWRVRTPREAVWEAIHQAEPLAGMVAGRRKRRGGQAARPIFCWNHDLLMRRGESGLKRRLEIP